MKNSKIQDLPVSVETMRSMPIMAHWVLGYPTLAESERTILQLAEAGVQYLELQIPFSHPTADGPLITDANRTALTNGTTLAAALEVVARVRAAHPAQHIVVMTYANKVQSVGYSGFATQALAVGATSLIVPDLPFDAPEADLLRNASLDLIPVLGPNVSEARLLMLLSRSPKQVYLMAGYKITGSGFGLDVRLAGLVQTLRSAGVQVGIGFGISTPEQVQAVLRVADFAIIGSAFIQAAQQEKRVDKYLAKLRDALEHGS